MVHRCCISSCGMNVRVAEAKGLSYHGFPIKEPLREQWIQAILPHLDRPEIFKIVPKYTRVCSRHFKKKDYSVDIKKRARLNSNAVPSVFPRKNSPIIVPNVLSSPSRSKVKVETVTQPQPPRNQNIQHIQNLQLQNDCLPPTPTTTTTTHFITLPQQSLSSDGQGHSHHIVFTVGKNGEELVASLEGTSYIIDTRSLSDISENQSAVTLTLCDGVGDYADLDLDLVDLASSSSQSQSQEDLSQSQSQSQSQSSNLSLNENEDDSNEAPHKKRKRRKWNRSAFDRPPKGKKKASSEDVNIDGVGEALAEISLSKFLAITSTAASTSTVDLQDNKSTSISGNTMKTSTKSTSTSTSTTTATATATMTSAGAGTETEGSNSNILQSVSLPLNSLNSYSSSSSLGNISNMLPDQVQHQHQHLNSIEQELLQSIQAVSLHCGGELELAGELREQNNDSVELTQHQLQLNELNDSVQYINSKGLSTYVLHHHSNSSQPVIFQENVNINNDDGQDTATGGGGETIQTIQSLNRQSGSEAENDLMAQFVDVGLGENQSESDRKETILEIDNLANHFNSSLLTTTSMSAMSAAISSIASISTISSITLAVSGIKGLGLGLHLPTSDPIDQETPSTTSSSIEDIDRLFLSDSFDLQDPFYPDSGREDDYEERKPSNSPRKKKSVEDVRLIGVTKKHKKEKMCGRFSVERFSHSDKDIEYYTGFSSYRQFENFFRSLEAYVERLRVTDVMFGVTNLDKLSPSTETGTEKSSPSSSSPEQFVSPLPPPPAFSKPQKPRPFHGRSMTRIDELFMTVIRLKRKLPERVLGHMFCISQPTVSRIIRAWTVLLSKLIDRYPVETSHEKSKDKSAKAKTGSNASSNSSEHSYTSRGLCVPESFKQLFHSDLAQTIIVTSVNAKDKKTSASASTSTIVTKIKEVKVKDEPQEQKTSASTCTPKRSKKLRIDADSLSVSTSSQNQNQNHINDNDACQDIVPATARLVSVSSSIASGSVGVGPTDSELDAAVDSLFSSVLEENELFEDVSFI